MDNKTSNTVTPNSQQGSGNSNIYDTQPEASQAESTLIDSPNLGAIRKSGQQEVLQALAKAAGVEFAKPKDAVKFIESLVQNKPGGTVTPKEEKSSGKVGGELAELRSMIQGLQSQLELKDRSVRQATLQSQIKETAIRQGFDPNMLDIATNLFESNIDYDESGSFYVKGANGSVKLDSKGNPYTLELLANDILRSRPKLAADEGRTGTGSRFGQGVQRNPDDIPDASTDIEGWKKWKEQNGIGGRSLKAMSVSINKPIV
jgi:hypothetical protein